MLDASDREAICAMLQNQPQVAPCDCKWGAKDVVLIVTMLGSLVMGWRNNEGIADNNKLGHQQVQQADEVKKELDTATAASDRKFGSLAMGTEAILLGNYEYLRGRVDAEDITEEERKLRRRQAEESRKIYDEFVKRKNGSRP